MTRTRKELGDQGESAALAYLRERGYVLIERNLRKRNGEIDLVLRDRDVLVFCEVKTSSLGFAFESYGSRQQRRMRTLVLAYLARSNWQGPVRVDLMALEREAASARFHVQHFEDVLSVDDPWC